MNTVDKLLKMDAGKLTIPEKEVKIKLKKFDDEEFVFLCKVVDPEKMAEIQENALELRKGDVKRIKMYEMKVLTLIEGCPDVFKNKDVMKHFGAPTPKELIKKLLLSGEIDELYNEINKLGGYEEEDEEEVKN